MNIFKYNYFSPAFWIANTATVILSEIVLRAYTVLTWVLRRNRTNGIEKEVYYQELAFAIMETENSHLQVEDPWCNSLSIWRLGNQESWWCHSQSEGRGRWMTYPSSSNDSREKGAHSSFSPSSNVQSWNLVWLWLHYIVIHSNSIYWAGEICNQISVLKLLLLSAEWIRGGSMEVGRPNRRSLWCLGKWRWKLD